MQVGRNTPPSYVRLPVDLKDWLKGQAANNRRSLNSEILSRLEQSKQQQESKQ